MSENLDYESWRCSKDEKLFCPPEGCTKHDGCARERVALNRFFNRESANQTARLTALPQAGPLEPPEGE